jgi:hypothetical protein
MKKYYIISTALVTVVFLLVVGGRVLSLQRMHYLAAEGHHAEQNWKLAIREYGLAMHMYTPWSPYIEKSAQRLWQIGEMHENEGRPDWALIAYSALRSELLYPRERMDREV